MIVASFVWMASYIPGRFSGLVRIPFLGLGGGISERSVERFVGGVAEVKVDGGGTAICGSVSDEEDDALELGLRSMVRQSEMKWRSEADVENGMRVERRSMRDRINKEDDRR